MKTIPWKHKWKRHIDTFYKSEAELEKAYNCKINIRQIHINNERPDYYTIRTGITFENESDAILFLLAAT